MPDSETSGHREAGRSRPPRRLKSRAGYWRRTMRPPNTLVRSEPGHTPGCAPSSVDHLPGQTPIAVEAERERAHQAAGQPGPNQARGEGNGTTLPELVIPAGTGCLGAPPPLQELPPGA